jgi:hypothetical protein
LGAEESPAGTRHDEGTGRRRFRLPTSLVVTVVGGAITILVVPALTRQWDERHRALDLKTSLVSQISTATGRSITAGEKVFETYDRRSLSFEEQTSNAAPGLPLRRRWLSDKLKIEGKLRAYFSPAVFARWRAYDRAMIAFAYIAGIEGRINSGRRQAERKYSLPPLSELDHMGIDFHMRQFPEQGGPAWDPEYAKSHLLGLNLWERREGFLSLEHVLLDMEASFTSQLLEEAPRGFSTTRHDLIHDLLGGS